MRAFILCSARAVAMGLALCLGLAATGCLFPDQSSSQAVGHYVRGQILADEGDLDAALAELAEAIRQNPNLSVAHAAVGDIHRKRGSYDLARACYETACQTNPYEFRPHYNLGVTYQTLAESADSAKAKDYLQKAIAVYLRAITLKADDFDTSLNLSACYFQEGKYDLAEKYCKEAVRLNPNNAAAMSNLGIIYDSQNKLWEAIKAYKDSLELDAHQPKLLLNLGSTYVRQNRLKDALMVLEMATREAPDDSTPWEQIGSVRYTLKEYDKSTEAYLKAMQVNPNSAFAYRGIGVVYMSQFITDQTQMTLRDKALEAWNRSLELDSNQQDLIRLVQKYTPPSTVPSL